MERLKWYWLPRLHYGVPVCRVKDNSTWKNGAGLEGEGESDGLFLRGLLCNLAGGDPFGAYLQRSVSIKVKGQYVWIIILYSDDYCKLLLWEESHYLLNKYFSGEVFQLVCDGWKLWSTFLIIGISV